MLQATGEGGTRYARKRGGDRSREGERDRAALMCLSDEPADWEPQRFQGHAGSRRTTVWNVQISPGRYSTHINSRTLQPLQHWLDQDL